MINPDGVRHQIEGNVIQSTSRALMEEVSFSGASVASREWGAYPIIKFPDLPKIDVLMLPRNDQPPLGVGESASVPSAAAIANAIYDATGVRFREPPFTPERILAGLRGEQTSHREALPSPASAAANTNRWSNPFAHATRCLGDRRRPCCRRHRYRHSDVALALDRADRPAGRLGVFGSHDRTRPATGRAWRLRDLPHLDQRRAQCRRPADRDAVRHHLQHQHHARCRDRDRQLVVSGL